MCAGGIGAQFNVRWRDHCVITLYRCALAGLACDKASREVVDTISCDFVNVQWWVDSAEQFSIPDIPKSHYGLYLGVTPASAHTPQPYPASTHLHRSRGFSLGLRL